MRTLSLLILAALPPVPGPDQPKRHVEEISAGKHAYSVRQGGTMDGSNCRTPLSVGMMDGPAIEQTWESNRAVRLENVGDTDVVNPWVSNGRNNFRNLDEIVASAVAPGMTDREKAQALWFQEIRQRYHWGGDNPELCDPVKVFNVYGHNTCGNDSICMSGVWKKAGLKVSPARLVGHCVAQVFYDGRWNLFDGDMHSMYLLRDNVTVASEQDLVRDHDLIKRAHTQGILNPESRRNDEWEASIYVFEGEPAGDRNCEMRTTMNMVLRPGEAITWRFGPGSPLKIHGEAKPKYPETICNGGWDYRPDFTKELWRKGATVEGVKSAAGELVAEEGKTGSIVWTVRSPYVFIGGKLESEGSGAKFSISWDGKAWMDAGPDLDGFFAPNAPARYEYRLRCELGAGARLKKLGISNDIQMALMALPGMSVGENKFVYTDATSGARKVRITHEWVERSTSRPPAAVGKPAYPSDGGEAEGTSFAFRWTPPQDADGDAVVDYHFELSERADMKYPLSTNFYRLISKTQDKGKSQYTLPQAGLLAPDRKYYWRVKAKDEKGVWGAWGGPWSFTSRGAAPPVDLTLAADPERGSAVLRWKPSPVGMKPVKYRIYGSDEKGFTASDEPYPVTIGASRDVTSPFPANFVTEVSGTEVELKESLRAYYRVVAVDDKGHRSGPSDFAESPRPVIYSKPVTAAKAGAAYAYPVASVRSIGDVRTRVVNGRETMSFWDIERPRYALTQGPAWLKIDEATGVLSGTPDAAGKFPVVVTATIDREARKLDGPALSWGAEKVVSSAQERVGVATQKFTIEVAP
jgi:hypothetical protein